MQLCVPNKEGWATLTRPGTKSALSSRGGMSGMHGEAGREAGKEVQLTTPNNNMPLEKREDRVSAPTIGTHSRHKAEAMLEERFCFCHAFLMPCLLLWEGCFYRQTRSCLHSPKCLILAESHSHVQAASRPGRIDICHFLANV